LPSHQENFGIAVAEALACAKPVLVSNQVNIHNEIAAGGIIAADTLEGTKELLSKWLLLSVQDKRTMGQAALCSYHRHFESVAAATNLSNILHAALTI